MSPVPEAPPEPPDRPDVDSPERRGGPPADMREHFARLSRRSPPDPEAERAFAEGKLDMLLSDPNLTDEQKTAAIEELRQKLGDEPADPS